MRTYLVANGQWFMRIGYMAVGIFASSMFSMKLMR